MRSMHWANTGLLPTSDAGAVFLLTTKGVGAEVITEWRRGHADRARFECDTEETGEVKGDRLARKEPLLKGATAENATRATLVMLWTVPAAARGSGRHAVSAHRVHTLQLMARRASQP